MDVRKKTTKRKIDQELKSLFIYPEMVKSLLQGFVTESWVGQLDFSSLHTLNVNHISEDLKERDNDIIWKIQVNQQWLYLIFILEFQSGIDQFMPLRLVTYSGLIYQDMIKSAPKEYPIKELPPILPFVFYNGLSRWTAPLNLRECFNKHVPSSLMKYQPQIEYLLLDVGRINLGCYEKAKDNLAYSLIELEQARNIAQAREAISKAVKNLEGKVDSLKRAFHVYVTKVLDISEKYPSANVNELCRGNMLEERVKVWKRKERREGKVEGRKEGKHETLRSTIPMIWERLHSAAFPPHLKAKLDNASTEELDKILNNMLDKQFAIEE